MNLDQKKEIRAAVKWLRKSFHYRSQQRLTDDLVHRAFFCGVLTHSTHEENTQSLRTWFDFAVETRGVWLAEAARQVLKVMNFGFNYGRGLPMRITNVRIKGTVIV